MLKRFMKRAEEERGFTLIELMVVMLVIGILIAIALPTYLGARTRAQDQAAQADLRTTLVAAKTSYSDNGSYVAATPAGLATVEGSPKFVAATTPSALGNGYSVSVQRGAVNGVANQRFAAARMSISGTCYTIKDVAMTGGAGAGNTPRTWYGSTTTALNCTGAWALNNTTGTSFP